MKIIKGLILLFSFILITIIFAGVTVFILERKEKYVEVPNLYGKDMISATGVLKRNRLKMRIIFSYHNDIPKDYIVGQTPSPGETVGIGTRINVIVSLGMPKKEAPTIIGKSLFSAKIILSEKNLAPGLTTYIWSDEPKDSVLAFHSETGDEIKDGDRVNLLVSLGKKPRQFLMPELIGDELDIASSTIASIGLFLDKVIIEPGTDGVVLRQTPIPGMRISEGTKINLVVGISE
ncbi:TPA: hypothetical protein DCX16_04165 [bacterium]|nr:hypothetical protein [bacterium]